MKKALLLLSMICLPPLALAETTAYRWVDGAGQVHFSQVPPASGKYDVIRSSGAAAPSAATAPSSTDGSSAGVNAETQRFIEEAEAARAAKTEAKAKAKEEKATAEKNCVEARTRHQFLEERTARRLVAPSADGNLERMPEDEFLKRLGAAQTEIDKHCR